MPRAGRETAGAWSTEAPLHAPKMLDASGVELIAEVITRALDDAGLGHLLSPSTRCTCRPTARQKRTQPSLPRAVGRPRVATMASRNIQRAVAGYARDAGIPGSATPHTLRHACATEMMRRGVNLRIVQEALGRNWVSTTQAYTHVVSEDVRRAMAGALRPSSSRWFGVDPSRQRCLLI